MKWLYVLLVVPIVSLAWGAALAGSQPNDAMQSPSGNIHCRAYGTSKVVCTTTKPLRTVALVAGRHAYRPVTPIKVKSGPTVEYGDAWGGTLHEPFLNVQCASELTSMICTDFLTHGFTISRERVQTW